MATSVLLAVSLLGVSGAGRAAAGDAAGPAGSGTAVVAGTPCTVTARACVDLTTRRAWLLADGAVVRGPVFVRPGDADRPTPRGTFAVEWKAAQWTSREYLVAMPWSVFFAPGGIAFHEGAFTSPSAGCVKLTAQNAQAWFAHLAVGDEVQVR